jgi:RNA polymerase-binding protein DksA
MNKNTIKEIEGNLRKEKLKIEKELKKFTIEDKHVKDGYRTWFPDYGDKDDENTAEVATFSNNLSLKKNLEKSLRDIDNTLERIKKGTYGTCKYCGKEIQEKRLMIRPVSSACIECKKKLTKE